MEEYLDWTSIHEIKHYVFIINGSGIKLYTVIHDQHKHVLLHFIIYKIGPNY